ncbi:MAG: hypothetical protein BWY77_00699 [bacterium ADurb.Bin431]|nr:MAG: hypothetical protein BWY77_00699 [bacterium ADurb.Bin431]
MLAGGKGAVEQGQDPLPQQIDNPQTGPSRCGQCELDTRGRIDRIGVTVFKFEAQGPGFRLFDRRGLVANDRALPRLRRPGFHPEVVKGFGGDQAPAAQDLIIGHFPGEGKVLLPVAALADKMIVVVILDPAHIRRGFDREHQRAVQPDGAVRLQIQCHFRPLVWSKTPGVWAAEIAIGEDGLALGLLDGELAAGNAPAVGKTRFGVGEGGNRRESCGARVILVPDPGPVLPRHPVAIVVYVVDHIARQDRVIVDHAVIVGQIPRVAVEGLPFGILTQAADPDQIELVAAEAVVAGGVAGVEEPFLAAEFISGGREKYFRGAE